MRQPSTLFGVDRSRCAYAALRAHVAWPCGKESTVFAPEESERPWAYCRKHAQAELERLDGISKFHLTHGEASVSNRIRAEEIRAALAEAA